MTILITTAAQLSMFLLGWFEGKSIAHREDQKKHHSILHRILGAAIISWGVIMTTHRFVDNRTYLNWMILFVHLIIIYSGTAGSSRNYNTTSHITYMDKSNYWSRKHGKDRIQGPVYFIMKIIAIVGSGTCYYLLF